MNINFYKILNFFKKNLIYSSRKYILNIINCSRELIGFLKELQVLNFKKLL